MNLFAYGTLMAGRPEAERLAGCRYLGTAAAAGSLGRTAAGFPALLTGPGWVSGDLVELPVGAAGEQLLAALDAYEGVAEGLFVRESRPIAGEPAWLYVAGPKLEATPVHQPPGHGPVFWLPPSPREAGAKHG
ncbi:MAG: gamma-glutamylcyclotransferase family protein [Gemmatimonadales bacterium]